jgi:hypothetical protein
MRKAQPAAAKRGSSFGLFSRRKAKPAEAAEAPKAPAEKKGFLAGLRRKRAPEPAPPPPEAASPAPVAEDIAAKRARLLALKAELERRQGEK